MPGLRRREIMLAGGSLLAGCAHGPPANAFPKKLYYLGQSKVFSIDPVGGVPVTLVDHSPSDGARPTGVNDGIAIDDVFGLVYWTNMGRAAENDGYVMCASYEGRGLRTVISPGGAFTPKQLKFDWYERKLYWSDREGMAIQRCNVDGSGLETIVRTGDPIADRGDQSRWCVGIALGPGRYVYWTQKGGDNAGQGTIRRASIDMPGGATASTRRDIETLFSNLPEPIDLDLKPTSRWMYWTDRGDNTISRAPLHPEPGFDPARRKDRQVILSGLKEAIGIALDVDRNRLAFTSLGGEVGVARLDGSNARMLATDQGMLTGITWGWGSDLYEAMRRAEQRRAD